MSLRWGTSDEVYPTTSQQDMESQRCEKHNTFTHREFKAYSHRPLIINQKSPSLFVKSFTTKILIPITLILDTYLQSGITNYLDSDRTVLKKIVW